MIRSFGAALVAVVATMCLTGPDALHAEAIRSGR